MKMKRKMGTLMCCLIFAGMLYFDLLSAQAAVTATCKHPHYMEVYNARYSYMYDYSGHYERLGTKHVCADCGHVYWTDLRMEWAGDHNWVEVTVGYDTNGNLIKETRCSVCNWIK